MRAEELRHGNLIQKDGVTWVVNDIFGASGLVTILPGIDGETLGRRSIHDFDPIPLTPEILTEWCGFLQYEKNSKTTYNRKFVIKSSHRHPIIIHVIFWDNGDIVVQLRMEMYGKNIAEIKHLHQLQNLYFALTGNELKLTP